MNFSINIQQLKKCKSIKYYYYDYDYHTGETTYHECEPYDHFIWDLESEKKRWEGYGFEFRWSRYNTHPISGQLSDIWINEGMLHMIVDGNLIRILISIFDELYEFDDVYQFFGDHGGEFVYLEFYK